MALPIIAVPGLFRGRRAARPGDFRQVRRGAEPVVLEAAEEQGEAEQPLSGEPEPTVLVPLADWPDQAWRVWRERAGR